MEMNQSTEYGKQRIEFANNVKQPEDWDKWEANKNPFMFDFGPCWHHTTEYRVADYAAEVGFFIDVLGFDCNTISDDYIMIMSPGREFFFSFRPCKDGESPTPSDAITIEFFLNDLKATCEKLQARGIEFTHELAPDSPGSPMLTARFTTPNKMPIRLWGMEKDLPKN
jgi:catechol 2,3-dioxygenase-like lactoylglutathione lyase family enzyme